MRFSLRMLIAVMMLAGPLCAWGWREWQAYRIACEFDYHVPRTKGIIYLYDAETGDHVHPLTGERLRWNNAPTELPEANPCPASPCER
jgi:hypothetical protein